MTKDSRIVTINGKSYKVVAKKTDKYNRVSVYNEDNWERDVKNRTDIVYKKEYKHRLFGLLKYNATPIEKLSQECLNEAVCKRENKLQKENYFSERIQAAIDTVKEVHEDRAP